MWDSFEEVEVAPEPENRSRRIGWVLLSLVLIFSLLGSSVLGVAWLWQQRQADISALRQAVEAGETVPAESIVEDGLENEDAVGGELLAEAEETAVPTPVPLTLNRIVFVDPDSQIRTIAPTGEEMRILTGLNKRYSFPVWSPDGRQIAAVGITRTSATINVLTDDEDGETAVVYDSSQEPPFYLYWSPDSSHISFLASHADDPMALHLVRADGKETSHIITTGGPFYWMWAANSEKMLIHTGVVGEDARLAFVGVDGSRIGDNLAAPGYFQTPGISADGRFLAYAEEMFGQNSRIVIHNQDTGEQYQQRHDGVAAMGWSPVGNKLAYISTADEDGNGFYGPLRLVDAETNEVKLISRQDVVAFFWSPNGRFLTYIRASGERSDLNAKLVPSGPRIERSDSAQQFRLPKFDIVLVDTETGEGQILLRQAQLSFDFLTQYLPYFDQYALSHQIWSPRSEALVLPLVVDGQEQITVVSINGGRVQFLAEGSVAFWSRR